MSQTILVVEDDSDVRDVVTVILEDEGYVVEGAANGREGLKTLARIGPPCLILLDWWLPVISGREVLAHLRVNPETRTIPVVVMTSTNLGLPPASVPLLRKPFSIPKLLDTVTHYCPRKRAVHAGG
jgi:CheY-like chemotaxis protein